MPSDFHRSLQAGYDCAREGMPLTGVYDSSEALDVALVTGWRLGNRANNPPLIDPFAGRWPDVSQTIRRFGWVPK